MQYNVDVALNRHVWGATGLQKVGSEGCTMWHRMHWTDRMTKKELLAKVTRFGAGCWASSASHANLDQAHSLLCYGASAIASALHPCTYDALR